MLFDASPRISIVVSDSEQGCIKHGSELYGMCGYFASIGLEEER